MLHEPFIVIYDNFSWRAISHYSSSCVILLNVLHVLVAVELFLLLILKIGVGCYIQYMAFSDMCTVLVCGYDFFMQDVEVL